MGIIKIVAAGLVEIIIFTKVLREIVRKIGQLMGIEHIIEYILSDKIES